MNPRLLLERYRDLLLIGVTVLLSLALIVIVVHGLMLHGTVGAALRKVTSRVDTAPAGNGEGTADQNSGEQPPLPDDYAALLKTKHPFGAPPRQQVAVQGILGTEAFISGKWVEVGETHGAIKLIEITGDAVVVEVDGERQEHSVWQPLPGVASDAPGTGPGPPTSFGAPQPEVPGAQRKGPGAAAGERGRERHDRQLQRLRERFNLPPDFDPDNLTPEQREQFRQMMRRRMQQQRQQEQ